MSLKKPKNSFNFLELDNRLNTLKIQQAKKEQKQKNILNIYQKKLPNIQLINQCEKVLKSYQDHYNINRRFSIFHQGKMEKLKPLQNDHTNSIKNERSSTIPTSKSLLKMKSLSYFQAQKVMKPLKTNQYLNEKGIVLLSSKNAYSQKSNKKINEKIDSIQKDSRPKSYRIGLTMSNKSLPKQNTEQKLNDPLQQAKTQINKQKLTQNQMKRKRKLMLMFRHNVHLIINKLKLMKLSFSQFLQSRIFDKSVPYRFGQQIFYAIKDGNESKVFRIMMQKRLSIFSFDTTGKTTLIWACIRGYDKIAELLLSNGVQPHSQDINGRTAFFYAIKYNQFKCVKILFIYSYFLQEDLQKQNMTVDMRKLIRIGNSCHSFLRTFDNVDKRKEHFEHELKYQFH